MANKSPEDTTIEWLNEKWNGIKFCDSCGTKPSWAVSGPYASPMLNAGKLDKTKLAPVMTVTCTNCGYVMNYSAVVLGILRSDDI